MLIPLRRKVYLAVLLMLTTTFQGLPQPRSHALVANSTPTDSSAATPTAPEANLPEPRPLPAPQPFEKQQPNAPNAAVIVATLTDNVTAATKIAPGANINYTATITNNGAASPADDATNLNFSGPLDANTTLVAGSVHASPIARNDIYNWIGNTFLDTAARTLPAVTANDIAVNAPGGTDTFTVTAIAGGATTLGGTVTLASPSGAFTYTPPLNRPNLADGASVNDSFTYTITNSADPTLTSTGTVTIGLTGRVFYLQAGAAGDGRSGTPSSNPATMSTNADKSTDIFYIFSNAGSLNGLFTVDAGQQLLGSGVNLVVNIPTLGSVTLFSSAAPTPTTTNSAAASNCVTLAGAPGNNTLSGFNIGNCTGLAIQGANVGTLTIGTMSINTTGGGLNLTGVGTPTVNVVLGGLTATGGTVGANLVGLNGTINLAGGTLSGASGAEFTVSGGGPTVTYTGAITQNNAQRVVNIQGTTANSVTLSGTITGGQNSQGVHIGDTTAVNGNVTFTTLNLGTSLARMTNQAVTITNGASTATYALGTVNIFTNNVSGLAATNFDGTLNSTSGTVDSSNATAINIDGPGGLTTLGMTLTRVDSAGGTAAGIVIQDTNGTFVINGDGSNTTVGGNSSGGVISNKSGADGATNGNGVFLSNVSGVTLRRMTVNGTNQNHGIRGNNVTNFTLEYSTVTGTNGTNIATDEGSVNFDNLLGSAAITSCSIDGGLEDNLNVVNTSGTLNRLVISGSTFGLNNTVSGNNNILIEAQNAGTVLNFTLQSSLIKGARADWINFSNNNGTTMDAVIGGSTPALGNTFDNLGANHNSGSAAGGNRVVGGAIGTQTVDIRNNTMQGSLGEAIRVRSTALGCAPNGGACGMGPTGTVNARVRNNTIGLVGTANSGSSEGSGIFAFGDGGSDMTIAITDNVVRQTNNHGIRLTFGDEINNGSVFNATVTGNSMTNPGTLNTDFTGITMSNGSVGATDDFTTCANIGGAGALKNTVTGYKSGVIYPNNAEIRLQQRQSTTVLMPGYAGGNTDTAAVENFVFGRNTMSNPGDTNGGGGADGAPDSSAASVQNAVAPSTRGFQNTPGGGPCTQPTVPLIAPPADDSVHNRTNEDLNPDPSTLAMSNVEPELGKAPALTVPVVASVAGPSYRATIGSAMHYAYTTIAGVAHNLDSIITPTVYAQDSAPNAPTSGETITLNAIATFPAGGKSITIKYSATVNAPPTARQLSTQGTVTANGGISVLTDDPEPAGSANPTVTLVNTTMTWNGATSTDWNTATNWTQPAGGTQYAPGVSNPAVNDVVIPNVGAQPNIGVSDIGVFSLNLANGRTLTITSPRVLTIGGSPGGDLTLDGIISGGSLNLGTGTHVINNAGGTGSLSSTNMATVLSGSTVTLNNNLQAGALGVNAGGSMNITNRTLSLNGTLGLVVPGGVTFTTTGSTVIFNGTAVQQAAGIAYNNLTINNTTGLNVTGVTLIGNATVNGTLTLTSSDLATGAFTLTQPNTTASTGVSDVVGTVSRTGGPFAIGTPLTFGNPNNILTITAGATRPTTVTMNIAKAAPANPNGYSAAVQRTYTISQTAGSGFTSTLRLHYLDSELNGNTPEASLNLRRLRISDNHWTVHLPTTVDSTNNWVQSTTVLDTELSTRWTMSTFAPTASNGMVTGRIVDAIGNPVEGAVVTLNGTQNRKFITDANGFYRFDNVETGGLYTVTPARANFNFNPFNRSFNLLGNATEASFTGNLMGDNANPLDTAEYFVRQQYVDILGREPDEAGFNYWSDHILACGDDAACIRSERTGVAAAFFIENEFRQSGAYIYDVYESALGRRPVYSEYRVDRAHVIGGPTLEEQKQAFAAAFVARAEFANRYAGNTSAESFVDALLSNAQSAGIDLSGQRDGLITRYSEGASMNESRALVLRDVSDNAAVRDAHYNAAFVTVEYFGYLHRTPEAAGFAFWLNVLNSTDANNYRGMVCSFITATEYQHRFSTVVSHSNAECGQ